MNRLMLALETELSGLLREQHMLLISELSFRPSCRQATLRCFCLCLLLWGSAFVKCGGQSTLSWSGFSPSIFIWDLGIKFRLPGFVARAFTHRTISLAPPRIVSKEKWSILTASKLCCSGLCLERHLLVDSSISGKAWPHGSQGLGSFLLWV